MPERSLKNQPQLVYMSMALRCISSSSRTATFACGAPIVVRHLPRQEALDVVFGAVEHDVDVVVARAPRIAQQRAAAHLEDRDALVAQPVERVAQRRAPLLIPSRAAAGAAAAVALPAPEAVVAAPRGALGDLHFVRRRRGGEKLAVVRDARQLLLVDVVERVRQGHVAVAMMVAIRLAVGGDVDELRMIAPFAECAEEAMREVLAAREQALEGDGARDRRRRRRRCRSIVPTADCSDTASSDRSRRSARSNARRRSSASAAPDAARGS